MARYRKIDTRIWNDAKFNGLSERGKLVFFFGLTHPNLTMLGAMRATIPGLAAEIGIPAEAFREAFQEALLKGMTKHDEKASFLWFPNFLRYNKPESPNVVKSWPEAYDLVPECTLKQDLFQHVKAYAEGLTEAFGKAFHEAFAKTMPNQEPEQEPEYISPATPTTQKHPPSEEKRTRKAKIPESVLVEIYEAYPRHIGKREALKSIEKAMREIEPEHDATWLLERTRLYAKQRQGEDEKYTPHPATWFNKKRYEDESLDGGVAVNRVWLDAEGNPIL